MKKLITSNISTSVAMPIKAGTLDFLQLAHQETVEALVKSIIGSSYDTSKFYILYGCVNSGSGLNFVISAGAIFYNGEIYLVDAATFTASGGHTAVGTITITQYTTNADPVTFTDGSTHNVHNIRKIVFADGVSGSGDVDFGDLIDNNWKISSDVSGFVFNNCTVTGGSVIGWRKSKRLPGGAVCLTFWVVFTVTAQTGLFSVTIPIFENSKVETVGGNLILHSGTAIAYKGSSVTPIVMGINTPQLLTAINDSILVFSSDQLPSTGGYTLQGSIIYESE